jgi:hypothetical protein
MRGDVLVDLRNIYLPAQARAAGFSYTSIGHHENQSDPLSLSSTACFGKPPQRKGGGH